MNQYKPWDALGIDELEYFKRRYLQARTEAHVFELALDEAREGLELMADGEGDDHEVYMQISRFRLKQIARILALLPNDDKIKTP